MGSDNTGSVSPDALRQAAKRWRDDHPDMFPLLVFFTNICVFHQHRREIPILLVEESLLFTTCLLFLLRYKEHSSEQRHHHRPSACHVSSSPSHIIRIRRANSARLLKLEPFPLHRLLDLLEGKLKTLLVSLVHFLHRDVFRALPVIQQRAQIDPVPARLQDLVDHLDVATIKKGEKEKLEDNRGCVDEKAGQNAIPFVLLRLVALQKLAGAHRKVASLLNGSAGHDVGHENAAIIVALREDIVGIVRPGIDFDLVVRVE